jgi:spore maturation protein CgeB
MTQYTHRTDSQQASKVRICVPTMRSISREVFRCGLYEAQDVLAETNDVDLIDFQPGPQFRRRDLWHRRLLFRGLFPSLARTNPGLQKVRLTQDYDLFVALCQNTWDLMYLNAIEGWKERCRVSVCWVDELWASSIPTRRELTRGLCNFDHVFIACQGMVDRLSDFLGKRCHFLPAATDTIRFSPLPNPPARSIDVYGIGRRWEGIHQALLGAKNGLFYIHDTYRDVANMEPIDYRQHRQMFANMTKRSKYFVVSPAKMNAPEETLGQVELGHRYFEGAAAGAVMIGEAPDSEAFRELFAWPDAVVPVRPDGTDILKVLTELNGNPERISTISRRNVVESLLRHDWLHRWKRIFELSGIEVSPGMIAREERLRDLAHAALQVAETEPASLVRQ